MTIGGASRLYSVKTKWKEGWEVYGHVWFGFYGSGGMKSCLKGRNEILLGSRPK